MPQYKHNICLFISSSDNTLDVLRHVIPSFEKFWPDCPFEKFVGLNSAVDPKAIDGFHPVYAPVSGWRAELLEQIFHLPEQYGYILLFLDDFLILSPVNGDRLRLLFDEALHREIDYLRLVPIRRAAIQRIANRIYRKNRGGIEPIGAGSPYYSSLQAALWKRRHLADMLALRERDVWEFEHQQLNGHPHFAISGSPPIHYRHIVEKGRWQPYARRLFAKLDLPFRGGERGMHSPHAHLTLWLNRVKFELVGYAVVRLKRFLRS